MGYEKMQLNCIMESVAKKFLDFVPPKLKANILDISASGASILCTSFTKVQNSRHGERSETIDSAHYQAVIKH